LTGAAIALALALANAPAVAASPSLVLEPFAGGSFTRDTTPTFTGTSSDHFDAVTVDVYAGESATGELLRTPSGPPPGPGGKWSATVVTPLQDGTYTAVAKQSELGGLGETVYSEPYTFTVATQPPTVTLDAVPTPSNNPTPSFSGTASDTTVVTVSVYSGASAEGSAVATLKAQGTGGGWASASIQSPLPDGEYAAVATQPSSLGNPTGKSNVVRFVVDTEPPVVTLNAPPALSNDRTPSFSGTASDATPVTVEVFEGTRAEGDVVRAAQAEGTRAGWTSPDLAPPLPSGRHTFTAIAIQASSLGNPSGRSEPVTFVLDTEAPSVTVLAPPSPSNHTTPSFSGTASETTPVTVEIFAGTAPEGAVVSSATGTPKGGSWTSSAASPALADGTYTAVAVEASAIENPIGTSAPVTFTVDTQPPVVTLNPLPTPSANAAPSFSGTASDSTAVTVNVYRGALATGEVVASASAEVDAGAWLAPSLSAKLEWGEYTAVATQPSSLGNPAGASAPFTFVVAQIAPAAATEAASGVTPTTAALYGSVNPRGAPVGECYFEYGTTPAYGARVGCGFVAEVSGFPAAGTTAVPVFARVFALTPSTTYHFRVVAIGEGGEADGSDETLTTGAAPDFGEGGATGSAAGKGQSAAEVAAAKAAAAIAKASAPRGGAARISSLLRRGAFLARVRAARGGRATVGWYYRPGRRGGGHSRAVRVASGALTLRANRAGMLRVVLTAAGRRLLGSAHQLKLVARCTFKAKGAKAVTRAVAFKLTL
jgi:large repetitive protein